MIVTTDNLTDERRAYASGLRVAADIVEHWMVGHSWWNFWMLPHTIRRSLAALRDGAQIIEECADEQDARSPPETTQGQD